MRIKNYHIIIIRTEAAGPNTLFVCRENCVYTERPPGRPAVMNKFVFIFKYIIMVDSIHTCTHDAMPARVYRYTRRTSWDVILIWPKGSSWRHRITPPLPTTYHRLHTSHTLGLFGTTILLCRCVFENGGKTRAGSPLDTVCTRGEKVFGRTTRTQSSLRVPNIIVGGRCAASVVMSLFFYTRTLCNSYTVFTTDTATMFRNKNRIRCDNSEHH